MKAVIVNYDHSGIIGYGYWEGEEKIIESIKHICILLDKYPYYKTGLDAEAYMYEKNADIAKITSDAIKKYKHRFGLVGGTYGQPLSWSIHPEAVIRQFFKGKQIIKEIFGEDIKYYASSEQTFFPQLSQLLKLLEYEGVLLRTHFTMYGYVEPVNEEMIFWQSPNKKSFIKAITPYENQYFPRKECGGAPQKIIGV